MTHPLHPFVYCPRCGSRRFRAGDSRSKQCARCGFVYYANPGAATAAFVLRPTGELLVVRRAREPARGTLDLPGGFVDMGETAEAGLRREIREETGLDVHDVRYLFSTPNVYPYSGLDVHTLDLAFLVPLPSAAAVTLRAADDAAAAFWLPLSQLRPSDFGLTSIRHAVQRFLQEYGKRGTKRPPL